MIETAFLFAFF